MADEYKIYLVNETQSTQIFWAFLAPPQELVNDPNVYANSSASLAVASMSPGINTFTIPVQYVVSAGANNQAVGLKVKVDSSITENAELTQLWEAEYQTVPPQMGPNMILQPDITPPNTLGIQANGFNQAKNETAGWFSSMSFGIKTAAGFMGMSWSPDPGTKRVITPKLEFYITTGVFDSNTMASWTQVSKDAATLSVPRSFKLNAVTVTRTATGSWDIKPGKPPMSAFNGARGNLSSLVQSHLLLSQSQADLVSASRDDASGVSAEEVAALDGTQLGEQADKLLSVAWDSRVESRDGETYLTGTITVSTALTASFVVFVLAGIEFVVTSSTPGSRHVGFSYSGSRSVKAIKDLFVAGASLFFRGGSVESRHNGHPRLPASV